MKQLFSAVLTCALLTAAPAVAENEVQLPPQEPGAEPSLCLDGMEDMPMNDDLVPVPAGMIDGGCRVANGLIIST